MKKCNTTHKIAGALLLIGGLNWGLVGIGGFMGQNWDLINLILGNWSVLANIVYVLVGISAVMSLMGCKTCKSCEAPKEAPMGGSDMSM